MLLQSTFSLEGDSNYVYQRDCWGTVGRRGERKVR